ncbi:MAG: V-type ATP synthase subunit I [Oscillospiraceae bacterium]|nr:V-type ATP synthase subunit I [Oscillospiraceae bacterium]
MSIVKMKALTLLAPSKDVKLLLRTLQHFGCVEVSEAEAEEGFLPLESRSAMLRTFSRDVQAALDTMNSYVPAKKSMFAPRREVEEAAFWDKTTWRGDVRLAREVNSCEQTVQATIAKEAEFRAREESLVPWQSYPLPLDCKGTKHCRVIPGTLPAKTDLAEVQAALAERVEAAELYEISQDREFLYVVMLVHESVEKDAMVLMRGYGLSLPVWKDLHGTAVENQAAFRREMAALEKERELEIEQIKARCGSAERLETLQDRLQQYLAREEATERLQKGGSVTLLKGWLPADREEDFRKLMESTDCAFELRDPTEEEYPDVPVLLRNKKWVRPLNMVTEMYSLPAYNGVDPNPLMGPFFILFYGIMMADMGYGLLMMLSAWFMTKKTKPKGGMANFWGLMALGGASTFIMGAITGGFFGDFIPQLAKLINPESTLTLPSLFNPLDDALMVLIGSLALGLVQIFTGMGISAVRKIKKGDTASAVCDEIAWFLVFVIFGVGILIGQLKLAGIAIAVLLVVTQSYGKKGIAGKLVGIGGSLYNHVTGYFSDILSYSRLMALMLAGAVIAQVFNTLGAITGNVITFLLISAVGNALNFALNLLGCYVHDLRLQCLEFFSRFYEDGGKPFRPLEVNTKIVDIVKN